MVSAQLSSVMLGRTFSANPKLPSFELAREEDGKAFMFSLYTGFCGDLISTQLHNIQIYRSFGTQFDVVGRALVWLIPLARPT